MNRAGTNLQRLFAPKSVAVVGASTSPEKVGCQAVMALADFPGQVYPINPRATEVMGRRAFASLSALDQAPDLVMFAIPAPACVQAVREAIERGCGAGLILGGGFAESGSEGQALQSELVALRDRSTFRLLGPNTAGFVNKSANLTASFLPSAAQIRKGNIAVVAQSAGVNLTVSFLLEQLGAGVSLAVGLGNAIDVDAADVLEFLAEDDGTKAIALHLEGVTRGRKLFDVLRRVTPKKPVVVLTVGKEEVGEFAQSHTGNLIGSYGVRRSALLQAGAVLVGTTEQLASAAIVLAAHRLEPKRDAGVGILTAQAGPGLLLLDQLKSHGVSVPRLSEATTRRIAELLPPMTYQQNPVDTGRPSPTLPEVLEALASDEHVDLVLAYALHEPAALEPTKVLPPLADRLQKPLIFGTMGPGEAVTPTLVALRGRGMVVASSPEQLARAAVVLAQDAAQRARTLQPDEARVAMPNVTLPEGKSDEYAAKQLLQSLGIRTPRGIAANSHDEVLKAFAELSTPVALKIRSSELTHKTEVGGVLLNLGSEAELRDALTQLDAIEGLTQPAYLVEEMAPLGLELIVGATRDPSFGPTITVGLGGTLAELFKDTATRLAPLSERQANEMLSELGAAPLLSGWRGSPALDRQAVVRTIVLLGEVMALHSEVATIEINPLRVYESGVLALDAVVLREG